MKILSVRIKNLASISEAFIDFAAEPLASAGVFAITGATGAGKSTLLDALCLALYGKTPRYNLARESGVEIKDAGGSTISQGDVKSILMDGTASGFAEVTFEGLDKQIYRAEWQVKRAREKITGRLQSDTIQLFNVSTNTPFPEKKTETLAEIEKLIGLNYDQFTRSVLLAQGDFTAFLKADKDSKASLLEKLTGTEIYSDISIAIFNKCREATQELKDLTLKLEGVEILPEERVAELIEENKGIEKRLLENGSLSKLVEANISWYNTSEDLQNQKQTAETTLKTAEEELKKHEPGKKELAITEDVQVLKPKFEFKERILSALDKKIQDKEALNQAIAQLTNEISEKQQIIENNESFIREKREQQKEFQPKFIEARNLDTLLREKEKQAKQAQEQNQIIIQRKINQERIIADAQSKINDLTNQITEIESWCEKNAAGKLPAENISLINSKLKDGEGLFTFIEIENNNLEIAKNKLQLAIKNVLHLKEEIELENVSLFKVNETIQELKDKIIHLSPGDLTQKRDALQEKNADHINALSLWGQLLREKGNYSKGLKKTRQLSLQLEEDRKQLLIREDLLAEAIIKKGHSENILAKAKLQVANNVKSLRAHLTEGEECPVCGSLEHPFAMHNPQLDSVMDTLEKDARESNEAYETILKEKSGLEISIKSLVIQLEERKAEDEKVVAFINSMQMEWKKLPLEKECFNLPDEEISAWLENKIKLTGQELKGLKEQIDFFTNTKNQLDIEEEKKKKNDSKLKELEKQLTNNDWEIKTFESNKKQAEDSLQKNQNQLDKIAKELSAYFPKDDWIEKWKASPSEFCEKLQQFSQSWLGKIDQLQTCKEAISLLKIQLEGMKNQFSEIQEEAEKKLIGLNSIAGENLSLKNKRTALFKGENVDNVEKRLQEEIDEAVQKDEAEKKVQSALKNKLIARESEFKALTKTINVEESELENIQKTVTFWLSDYNEKTNAGLSLQVLEELIERDAKWIMDQREFFQKLGDSVVEAKSVFQDKSQMLQNHQSINKPTEMLEELQVKLAELNNSREISNVRRGAIRNQLEQHKLNEERYESLSVLLDKNRQESENWNKLSDLIGSPDGKKFRRIAQEYTLDILLIHANHHLEFLSKRYILSRIPDTLALQILDRNMGDEVRTVFSLSGGESFLVSLALALGLASLSSDKMQVESLFIDEGFGSLDPETLDMAMDALDRLHSQGRKVGVISHVQEMKERITTQIQVEKMSSGKSRVVVVS